MAAFLSPTGKHLVVLGVSGLENVVTMIKGDESGNVVINVCKDSIEQHGMDCIKIT